MGGRSGQCSDGEILCGIDGQPEMTIATSQIDLEYRIRTNRVGGMRERIFTKQTIFCR